MCVLSIKVPMRKKSRNLSYAPRKREYSSLERRQSHFCSKNKAKRDQNWYCYCHMTTRMKTHEKENSEFKPVKLRLKFDLVSHPARAEGLVNMIVTWPRDNQWTLFISFYFWMELVKTTCCSVGGGCWIHRLLLCEGVSPSHMFPGYDTKQSGGEAPVKLELCCLRSQVHSGWE